MIDVETRRSDMTLGLKVGLFHPPDVPHPSRPIREARRATPFKFPRLGVWRSNRPVCRKAIRSLANADGRIPPCRTARRSIREGSAAPRPGRLSELLLHGETPKQDWLVFAYSRQISEALRF